MNYPTSEYSSNYPGENKEARMFALIDEVYERVVNGKAAVSRDSLPDLQNDRLIPPVMMVRPRRKGGELGKAILDALFRAGRSGLRLQAIADETDSTPGSVSGWIYNNKLRVSGLRKLAAGLYCYHPNWWVS